MLTSDSSDEVPTEINGAWTKRLPDGLCAARRDRTAKVTEAHASQLHHHRLQPGSIDVGCAPQTGNRYF